MALAACETVEVGKVFGARLKQCRKALRLKQEAVGQAVEYSKSMISEIENGKQIPPLEKAVALARFFGVSVDALVSEEDGAVAIPWLAGLRRGDRGARLGIVGTVEQIVCVDFQRVGQRNKAFDVDRLSAMLQPTQHLDRDSRHRR